MAARPNTDKDFPYWLILLVGIGLWLFWEVWSSDLYARVLATLSKGIWHHRVCDLGRVFHGLGPGACCWRLASGSRFIVIRQIARFYIEVVRGVPIIVLLLYVAFAATPAVVFGWNWVSDRHRA